MSLLDQTTTAFIAGVTIAFGIVALGAVESLVEPELGGGLAQILGALGFAIGVVFLIVGRTELFTENFFDPRCHGDRRAGRIRQALPRPRWASS